MGVLKQQHLDDAEWDFPLNLSGQQLTACWIYEYARESEVLRAAAAEIKELRKKEWRYPHKKKNLKPKLTLKGKCLSYRYWKSDEIDSEILKLLPDCNPEEKAIIDRFYKRVGTYNDERTRRENLPDFDDAFVSVVRKYGIVSEQYQGTLEYIIYQPYFPNVPWSKLESEQQDLLVKRPLISKPIATANLDGFNEVHAAVPQCIKEQEPRDILGRAMGADWFCHPYALRDGQEIRPFRIDWAGSSNSEICSVFAEWVSRRREQVGIEEPRHRQTQRKVSPPGRGGDEDLRSRLYTLGIMRVLHACEIEKVNKVWPEAALQWLERESKGYASAETRKDYFQRWEESFLRECPQGNEAQMNYRRTLVDTRRGAARRTFKALFPFEKSTPVSWDLFRFT